MNGTIKSFYGALMVIIATSLFSSCSTQAPVPEQRFFIGDDIAVASTSYGKVKGYIMDNIFTFKGIPYGANTAGANRFMPPQPPQPWEGVRPAVYYGNICPQSTYNRDPENYSALVDDWNYTPMSEDCLRLNVWTPGLDDAKRPVMVYLHGGGYSSGSAIEQDGYGGENLARREDIVFVSINHRLNVFGFSNFASVGGDKYKYSGNVGMLDIIAALQWVRDNISNFGGDPYNVSIMGQSGGGSKVCTVAAMPAAKGLVNRGVALSGSSVGAADAANSEKLGEYILKEAGLKPSEIDKLQELSWEEYSALANKASRTMAEKEGVRAGFSPVADGEVIPTAFFSPDRDDVPDIPLIFSSVFFEFNSGRDDASLYTMTKEEAVSKLAESYDGDAQAIYDDFATMFPENNPRENYAMIIDARAGVGIFTSMNSATVKLQQKSPVYMAWFGWAPNNFDGRQHAFHCIDICFWLNNTDVMMTHTGGGSRPMALSNKMSDALGAFMRTDDPNGSSTLSSWPQFNTTDYPTIIIDDQDVVVNNPVGKARALIQAR